MHVYTIHIHMIITKKSDGHMNNMIIRILSIAVLADVAWVYVSACFRWICSLVIALVLLGAKLLRVGRI